MLMVQSRLQCSILCLQYGDLGELNFERCALRSDGGVHFYRSAAPGVNLAFAIAAKPVEDGTAVLDPAVG